MWCSSTWKQILFKQNDTFDRNPNQYSKLQFSAQWKHKMDCETNEPTVYQTSSRQPEVHRLLGLQWFSSVLKTSHTGQSRPVHHSWTSDRFVNHRGLLTNWFTWFRRFWPKRGKKKTSILPNDTPHLLFYIYIYILASNGLDIYIYIHKIKFSLGGAEKCCYPPHLGFILTYDMWRL